VREGKLTGYLPKPVSLIEFGKALDRLDAAFENIAPHATEPTGLGRVEEFASADVFLKEKAGVLRVAERLGEAEALRKAGPVVVVSGVSPESVVKEDQRTVVVYLDDTTDANGGSLAGEVDKWKADSQEPEKEFLIFLNYPTHALGGKVEPPAVLVRLAESKLPDPSPEIPVFTLHSFEQLSLLKPSTLYSAAFSEALKGRNLGPLAGVITYQEQGQLRHALIFA
jgi:hypothetical protein